ncbi:MAG: terpene cyclase/mutase family protein [Thermoguttaceae bacterium]|nr:terpene cyclase/mutase family protein [Thermoguttaceae bacterium]
MSDNAGVVTPKRKVSSWSASVFVHLIVLVALAFVFFPGKRNPRELEAFYSSEIGDQLEFLTDDEGNLNPNQDEQYKLNVPEELRIEDAIVFEKDELPFDPNVSAPLFDQSRIESSDFLSGRTDPGLKNDLLSKYGGNRLTEEAVHRGLEWLKKQQQKDGSWSLQGPYANGISASYVDNEPAATALALLAFQGAGNTRVSGEHSSVVKRGWTWLLKQQNKDGSFAPEVRSNEALFYTQAICSIAICELIVQEKAESNNLRAQAQSAINFILDNQHAELGGWKYAPQTSSDLSVTGWCLMALKTAEIAGLEIPKTCFERISKFLDLVSYDDGAGYVYQLDYNRNTKKYAVTDERKSPSMTATGLMCREYLGWSPSVPALSRGAEFLASPENIEENFRFPSSSEEKGDFSKNVYGWYSTSMALKNLGPYNKHWRRWNAALSKELPKRQEPKGAKEAGSWDPQYDEYSFGGGRLYVTCLSILCLEVYYRHLSLHRPL